MNQSGMANRRRVKRRSLAYYMLVLDANTLQKIGHLVDITPIGLMMDSPKSFPVGKDFRLQLETTPDVADKTHITFTARCKWCRADAVNPEEYNVGFSIIAISPHDAGIVQRIVDKYATRDSSSIP